MLRISEIEWNGGQGLQDLSIHGIGPTKAMAEHLAGIIEGSVENVDHGAQYLFLGGVFIMNVCFENLKWGYHGAV
jgi:hypothetical protein